MKTTDKNLFSVIILMIILFWPQQAYADAVSLKVSPSLLQIEAKQPADIWAPFTIENQSGQPVRLTIGYKPIDPAKSSNGTVIFNIDHPVTNKLSTLLSRMQVVDKNNISHDVIDLGPKQKEMLRLRIPISNHDQSSDYYFTLLFVQTPQNNTQNVANTNIELQKSSSNLQAGIGINIFLSVGNSETPQGFIDTFTTPLLHKSGPVPFTLAVHNSGMHLLTAKGGITIKDLFGKTIVSVPVPTSIILVGATRNFSSTISDKIANKVSMDTPVLLSPEKFLFGLYKADLSLSLSDKGPVYTRSIHFLALPIVFIGEILLLIGVISYIYLRLKRKLSQ